MYSSEIETFLKERNYELTIDECNIVMDINNNPQISNIKFWTDNTYVVNTTDGYCFVFKVIDN